MLHVQLYFVKLFGCKIVQDNVPISIEPFQHSLLQAKPHKNIYLSIGPRPGDLERKYAGVTPIESLNLNRGSAFATWFYIIDMILEKAPWAPGGLFRYNGGISNP
jgi:hypothetical protein